MRRPRRARAVHATAFATVLCASSAGAGGTVVQEDKLRAADSFPGLEFAHSVAIDGDTAVVGAIRDDEAGTWAGAVYVFVRVGTNWSQQAKLVPVDLGQANFLGESVAIDGDTLVAGAPLQNAGAAYVYVRQGLTWTQQAKLVGSGPATGRLGHSVAIHGDTIVAGAYLDDAPAMDSGSAYVFARAGTSWSEQQKLTASDGTAADLFGWSVAVDGDTAVVGAYMDVFDTGKAYAYSRSGTTWTEQAVLLASNAAIGAHFGSAVDVSGDTAIVGADSASPAGSIQAGSAYVYLRQGTTWTEQANLMASDAGTSDHFGSSVALEGESALVGAYGDTLGNLVSAGSAYAFGRAGGAWVERSKIEAGDPASGDRFGTSVGLSGSTVAVGAPFNDGAGSAYVFRAPVYEAYCTAGTSASGCQATLSAFGTPSATAASGFFLKAVDVEGNKGGLFYFGSSGKQATPLGNGSSFRCVAQPVFRGALLPGTGAGGTCGGSFDYDLNARWTAKPNQNPGAGALVQAQFWYRDPESTSNQTTSLSDALEFCVAP